MAVRRWELRQIDYAAGSWYRLTRVLALSRRAWVLSERDAERLIRAGHHPHPAGLDFEPPRRLFIISLEEVDLLDNPHEIPLRASPEILLAKTLALVPFEGTDPRQ